MDFQQLLARMQELDQPTVEQATDECGMMPPASPAMPPKSNEPPPSMSVNLNAQGMENIEDLMKLIMKVNPDAAKDSGLPSMSAPPAIMSIKPEMPPMKMLPDMDSDNDDMPGGEKDIPVKKDEWSNSPDVEVDDVDAAVPSGDDLHKQKGAYKAAAGGDNPMKAEGADLRAQIRAELLQRLAEAKGVK